VPNNLISHPLDNYSYHSTFHPIPSLLKGRCRDACSAGRDAVPEGGGLTWLFVRGSTWVSVRPHYRGLPPKLAGRGQAAARNRRAPSPRKRGPRLHHRGGTLKGVAVCLCFSAIREISRGRYPKVRLSAFRLPLFFRERGSPNLPFTRSDLRAAMTLAQNLREHQHAQLADFMGCANPQRPCEGRNRARGKRAGRPGLEQRRDLRRASRIRPPQALCDLPVAGMPPGAQLPRQSDDLPAAQRRQSRRGVRRAYLCADPGAAPWRLVAAPKAGRAGSGDAEAAGEKVNGRVGNRARNKLRRHPEVRAKRASKDSHGHWRSWRSFEARRGAASTSG
jgi:hypothetical protein